MAVASLLAGDAIFPVADGNVTFLRSYPNRIPLSAAVVRRLRRRRWRLERFDRLYNNFASCIRGRCPPDCPVLGRNAMHAGFQANSTI